jgi:drug/metabolite transporter (DMT)-like permease
VGETNGLAFGLIAAAMWGTLDVLVAFAGRRVGGVASAAIVVGTSAVLFVAIALATGTGMPTDPQDLALSIASGLVSSVGFACFYTALRLGPVSVVSPTAAVYGGLASLLAVVFLGERPAPIQLAGVAAATIGIALAGVSFHRGGERPRFTGPGVPFALVSLVAWALSIVLVAVPIAHAGWLSASVAARAGNVLLLVVLLAFVHRRVAPAADLPALAPEPEPPFVLPDAIASAASAGLDRAPGSGGRARGIAAALGRHPVALLVGGGFLETVGFVAFSYGLQVAPAWLVSLVSSLGPIVTVSAGILLFGERPRTIQWAGIGLVLAGIVLVAAG